MLTAPVAVPERICRLHANDRAHGNNARAETVSALLRIGGWGVDRSEILSAFSRERHVSHSHIHIGQCTHHALFVPLLMLAHVGAAGALEEFTNTLGKSSACT